MNTTTQKIEALLYYKNEPVSFKAIARILQISVTNVRETITSMNESHYQDRGFFLIVHDDEAQLVTHPDVANFINDLVQEDESKALSKQALETLAIILLKKEVTKSYIDFVRGVNSLYILRNLLVKGLVRKKPNPEDRRSPLYIITQDLLAYLNLTHVSEFPNYKEYQKSLQELDLAYQKQEDEQSLTDTSLNEEE